MLLRDFNGKQPRLGQGVFVADDVSIIGDVELGNDVSVWYGVVLRGDIHFIRIGSRTNIQDNCVLHVTGGAHPTVVAEEVTIGHAAIVHGCTVKRGALIGMGSRVLDGAVVGEAALVGAGALDDLASHPQHELGADLLRGRDELGRGAALPVDDDLADAAAIAEVGEDQLSEVALLLNPAVEGDGLAGVGLAKRSCVHDWERYRSL